MTFYLIQCGLLPGNTEAVIYGDTEHEKDTAIRQCPVILKVYALRRQ